MAVAVEPQPEPRKPRLSVVNDIFSVRRRVDSLISQHVGVGATDSQIVASLRKTLTEAEKDVLLESVYREATASVRKDLRMRANTSEQVIERAPLRAGNVSGTEDDAKVRAELKMAMDTLKLSHTDKPSLALQAAAFQRLRRVPMYDPDLKRDIALGDGDDDFFERSIRYYESKMNGYGLRIGTLKATWDFKKKVGTNTFGEAIDLVNEKGLEVEDELLNRMMLLDPENDTPA